MSALHLQALGRLSFPGLRAAPKPGSVALLPLQREKFCKLVAALRETLAAIGAIEEEVRDQVLAYGVADQASRELWKTALLVGREAEIAPLRERGQLEQRELEAFSQCLGFSSSERLAYLCGLPSPLAKEGDQ